MLRRISFPSRLDSAPIDPATVGLIDVSIERVRAFQDRWDRPQIEQFVAADYALVFRALRWTWESQPRLGDRFVEWGCGFAVVSSMAARLGFDAIGIEAESDLVAEGERTLAQWGVEAELVHGNFLPPSSESFSEDPTLPSLGHEVACGYRQLEMDLSDFAMVYSYPWPGEDDFHELVFDRFAAPGALLLQFCGPEDVRLWRKYERPDGR